MSWNPAPAQTTPSAASVTFQYAYDGDSRRINQTATNSSWWSYPTTASALTYTTNALNQYTCIFASTCSSNLLYDANGNLIFDGTFTYNYDAESRLTGILNGATVVASYEYDAQGRRKSKTVGSTTTDYVIDADDREVLEYDGAAGTEENWYAYGLGANDVLNRMNLTGSTRETMVPDIQGSVIATLDASSGALGNTGYQTFGENPSLSSGTFQYTAQRFDPETAGSASEPSGLYYYRARMYSPTLGRFLQPDPAGFMGSGMNLYAYVGNDPTNFTDPDGRCYPVCTVVGGAAIGAVVGGGVYVYANWNNLTWGGFFARTAQGAVIGGLAGGGVPISVLVGAGAGANVVTTFFQEASQNNLEGYYGATFEQNAGKVTEDALIGGTSVWAGQAASEIIAPGVNNLIGTFGADVLENPGISNETSATVISLVNASGEPVNQTVEALGEDVVEQVLDAGIDKINENLANISLSGTSDSLAGSSALSPK